MNTDACMSQYRVIIGMESVEVVGACLAGPVSSHQIIFEENTNLLNYRRITIVSRSNLNGCNQIFLSIRTKHTDRKL